MRGCTGTRGDGRRRHMRAPSRTSTSSTTTSGGLASGFRLGVAMLGGSSVTMVGPGMAPHGGPHASFWGSAPGEGGVGRGGCGSCSTSSRSPCRLTVVLPHFQFIDKCWTSQLRRRDKDAQCQLRVDRRDSTAQFLGWCSRARCYATTGAGIQTVLSPWKCRSCSFFD